ncbi:MAG: hypothetical protein GY909_11815 [Oligoflexia bacterium]|nr:hypothetical protein [Oligoflexia bacterium]
MIDSLVLFLPILTLLIFENFKDGVLRQYFDIVMLIKVLILFIVSIFVSNTFAISFDYISQIIFTYTISSESLLLASVALLAVFSRKDITVADKSLLYLIPFSSSLSMTLAIVGFYSGLKYITENKTSYIFVLLLTLYTLFNGLEEMKIVGFGIAIVISYFVILENSIATKIASLLIIGKLIENTYIDISTVSVYISIFTIFSYLISMKKSSFEKSSIDFLSVLYISIIFLLLSLFSSAFLYLLLLLPFLINKKSKYLVYDFKEDKNMFRITQGLVLLVTIGAVVKYLSFIISNNEANPIVWIVSIILMIGTVLYFYTSKVSIYRESNKVEANTIILFIVSIILYYNGFYREDLSQELLLDLSYSMSFIFSSITLMFAIVTICYFLEKDDKKIRFIKKALNKIQISGKITKEDNKPNDEIVIIDNNGLNQFIKRKSDLVEALGVKKEDTVIYLILSTFLCFLILVRLFALSEII